MRSSRSGVLIRGFSAMADQSPLRFCDPVAPPAVLPPPVPMLPRPAPGPPPGRVPPGWSGVATSPAAVPPDGCEGSGRVAWSPAVAPPVPAPLLGDCCACISGGSAFWLGVLLLAMSVSLRAGSANDHGSKRMARRNDDSTREIAVVAGIFQELFVSTTILGERNSVPMSREIQGGSDPVTITMPADAIPLASRNVCLEPAGPPADRQSTAPGASTAEPDRRRPPASCQQCCAPE